VTHLGDSALNVKPKAAVLAALIAAATAAAADGTVTGKVKTAPAKYLGETVVYLKGPKGSARPAQTKAMDQKSTIRTLMVPTRRDTTS
jgi:hypothetical protein